MRTRSVFIGICLAGGFTVAAGADVPDGRGGRTSPQGLTQPKPRDVVAVAACCREPDTQSYRHRVMNPVERKTMGHLAWVDARTGPAPLTFCYKTAPRVEARFNSPAELKALGHVARLEVAGVETSTRTATTSCCKNQEAIRHCRVAVHRQP